MFYEVKISKGLQDINNTCVYKNTDIHVRYIRMCVHICLCVGI